MQELLTIEEVAARLKVNPETVRRQLRGGKLRGVKRGKSWRVPESSLPGNTSRVSGRAGLPGRAESEAQLIMRDLRSENASIRNAAIIALAHAAPAARAIVEAAAAKAAEEYYATPTGQADLADWRALDGEPFDFGVENAKGNGTT